MLDLETSHPFAWERVGFVFGRLSRGLHSTLVLLNRYHSIPDDQYLSDETVGARIGPDAMTWAMQAVYHGRSSREGIFHIHLHSHRGPTRMSSTDSREIPPIIPGFKSVSRDATHGIIVLSSDHGTGWLWLPGSSMPHQVDAVTVVGAPIGIFTKERLTT